MQSSSLVAAESPLLRLEGVSKAFTGVQALRDVGLDVRRGEVHAIVGENGAGKSTLIKILAGAHMPDSGSIEWNGERVAIVNPHHSQSLGIATIFQEFSLIPELSAMENILLAREPAKLGFIRYDSMRQAATRALREIGAQMDPDTKVSRMSVAQMQMVEIAKAVSQDARLLIMDEPSATLTEHELEGLYGLVRRLRDSGRSVLYVSHRLEEVLSLADRITVLRDGAHVGTLEAGSATTGELVKLMVGREITDQYPKAQTSRGEPVLEFDGVTTIKLKNVTFQVHSGEIVGVAGLVGSGRSALGRAAMGVDRIRSGQVRVFGKPLPRTSPGRSIQAGIGLLSEDRKRHGLVLQMTVRENMSLASLDTISKLGFVERKREAQKAADLGSRLNVRMSSLEQEVVQLSGGNQQKVLIGRWLWRQCPILIFDEPTRGVDVGAKAEIYTILRGLAEQGAAILMISSELPEVLGMADRVVVMRDGGAVAEMDAASAAQEEVMHLALGSPVDA